MYFGKFHKELQEQARYFAQKELTDELLIQTEKTGIFPKDVIHKMARAGFLGIKTPKVYGGMGGDHRAYALVMEEIASVSAVASLYISSPNSLSGGPLLLSGTPEQIDKYLRPCTAGEKMLCFALTEPGAGSDAGGIVTKAVKEGSGYILNGRKTFITMAPLSDYAIIYAKTDKNQRTKGISAFIVDLKSRGISFGKPENKMGLIGCATADIVLDNVWVDEKDRLGEENEGFINAMKTLDVGRLGVAAQSVGVARGALEDVICFVRENGLASHQGIAFGIAKMASAFEAARQLVYEAAWQKDCGQDLKKASLAASMAKLQASETCVQICNKAVEICADYGCTWGTKIERRFRDCQVFTIYEGTSQVQQMAIARQLLGEK